MSFGKLVMRDSCCYTTKHISSTPASNGGERVIPSADRSPRLALPRVRQAAPALGCRSTRRGRRRLGYLRQLRAGWIGRRPGRETLKTRARRKQEGNEVGRGNGVEGEKESRLFHCVLCKTLFFRLAFHVPSPYPMQQHHTRCGPVAPPSARRRRSDQMSSLLSAQGRPARVPERMYA